MKFFRPLENKKYSILVFGDADNDSIEYAKTFSDEIVFYKSEEDLGRNYDIIFDFHYIDQMDINQCKEFMEKIFRITDYFYTISNNYINDEFKTHIFQALSTNYFEIDGVFPYKIRQIEKIHFPRRIVCHFVFKSRRKRIENLENKVTEYVSKTNNFRRNINSRYTDIAIIGDFDDYYSGSNYYEFSLGVLLSELQYNVKLFSDKKPIMYDDFSHYNKPDLKIDSDIFSKENPLIYQSKIYIGTPFDGANKALEYGAKYNSSVYILLYDCPLLLNKTKLKEHASIYNDLCDKLKINIHKYKDSIDDLNIVSLTKKDIRYWAKYLKIPKKYIKFFEPTLNYRLIDEIEDLPKQNWIVAVGRNDLNKNWSETLEVLNNLPKDYQLHIIGSPKPLGEFKKHPNCVIHNSINDRKKFSIIKQSKLLISNTIFEGFGIPILESLQCNTPVVCYDLPPLKHIKNPNLHKIRRFNKKKFIKTVLGKINSKAVLPYVYNKSEKEDERQIKELIGDRFYKHANEFGPIYDKKDIEVNVAFPVEPAVYHFNSIYNGIMPHSVENVEIWNQLVSNTLSLDKFVNHKYLSIFTFNTRPRMSILESTCNGLKIDVLCRGINNFHLNQKLKYAKEYLESINTEYVLFLDAFDIVLLSDPVKLIDACRYDQVLFAAEEVCHPESFEIQSEQEFIAPTDTPFKFLNSGVYCGKVKNVLEIVKMSCELKKYESSSPMCDDCDQGKFNQVYIKHPELFYLDFYSQYVFCSDYYTKADRYITVK